MKFSYIAFILTFLLVTSGCTQTPNFEQTTDPEALARDASIFENNDFLQNTDTFEKWLKEAYSDADAYKSTEERILKFARAQLGIPYIGGLLEVPKQESLVLTLKGSDCVLFVEYSLGLTLTSLQNSTSYKDLARNIAILRYYQGIVDGYASRQHYFSDWLRSNEEKGLLEILFQDDESLRNLGPVTFMSKNREAYRQLAESDSLYKLIVEREHYLNAKTPLKVIPQNRIPEFESQFRSGDILSFVSTIDGLDIAHTAIVEIDSSNGRVGFLHASTTGEVISDPKTIFEYTRDRRNVNGIIIARLK